MLLIMVALAYAKKDDQTVVIHSFGKFPHGVTNRDLCNEVKLEISTSERDPDLWNEV